MPDITQLEKHECTGCSACGNICPNSCVYFEYNDEGFLYPQIGQECVECGLCAKVCPVLTEKTKRVPDIDQYVVAAVSHDASTCCSSSSGGAFTEICKAYGDQKTVVFGARFDGLKVVHSHVVGVENITPFCKSKYVQSDMGNCLAEAKTFLDEKRKVIFSGTPCQIAGLRSYLRKEYEHLLCIDVICHGVGSPKIFEAALRYIEEKAGSNLLRYTFRNQIVRFGNRRDYISCHEFKDGRRVYDSSDIYQKFFLSQLCLRASCGENCKFRNPNRMGDITIADFKGKLKVFPNMIDNRNYSTISINSKKGNFVFWRLKNRMKILPCSMSDVEKFNPLFFKTTKSNPDRECFFRMYCEGASFNDLIEKFIPPRSDWRKYGWIKDYLIPFFMKRARRIFLNQCQLLCASFRQAVTRGAHFASIFFDKSR